MLLIADESWRKPVLQSEQFTESARLRKLRVAVFGLGHIGLPTALAISLSGYSVLGVDIDPDRVEHIRSGRVRQSEPGFLEKLRSSLETHRLQLTSEFDMSKDGSDVYVVCVQTPLIGKKKPDLRSVVQVCRLISKAVRAGSLVTVHSSLPPGTTRKKLAAMLETPSGLRCGRDFWLTVSPERLTPSLSLEEFTNNPRAVGGYSAECTRVASSFYSTIIRGELLLTDATVAEAAKLAENSFRDVNVAFANELALLCEDVGVPAVEVIRVANTHPRVRIHDPGAGVGGPCLPKDPYLLLASSRKSKSSSVVMAARKINDNMPNHVVGLVRRAMRGTGKGIAGSQIAVLGLAYKADVDDVTYSPAGRIITLLLRGHARVRTYDPYVEESLGGMKCESLGAAVEKASCLVFVTDHKMFRELDLREVRKVAGDDPVLVDGRNVFTESKAMEAGFHYAAVGGPHAS